MSDTFEFEAWSTEYELEQDTMDLLLEKGFKSYRSLRLLSQDDIRKDFKKLKPAQILLLQEGVAMLHPVQENNSVQQTASTSTASKDATIAAPPPIESGTMEPTQQMSVNDILKLCGLSNKPIEDNNQGMCDDEAATDPYGFG